LIAGFEVYDSQAARAYPGIRFDEIAAGIRTAMNQRIRHLGDDAFLDAACAIEINVTNYSAHVSKTVYRIFKIPNQQNEQ
jgi:hypothetical protein